MPVPYFEDMIVPTFQALKNLGGEGHIREIDEEVANLLNLSDDDILEVHKGNRTKLGYRLAWSRNYLKRNGLIAKAGRAYWKLTDLGERTESVDKDQVIRKVKILDGRVSDDSNSTAEDDDTVLDDETREDLDEAIIREQHNPGVEQEDTIGAEITEPFDPRKIDISHKTLILDSLFKRIVRGEINLLTDFQRKGDLWNHTKQSRLIESILIRFPLPAFYFDGSNDNQWLIVDGLQRISALRNFVITKSLRLDNLEFLRQFNGYGYDELPRDLQRRVDEAEITVYIINPGTPDDVKYNIFKRINTTALILEPQEIRHAINQGIPANFVKELADLEEFKIATCYTIKTDRMLDRDFVTRFISFYINDYNDYLPDLDTFMNKSMASIKQLSENDRNKIKVNFISAMSAAYRIFGVDAFRKRSNLKDNRKPINKALFEVWSVSLSKLSTTDVDRLITKKEQLIEGFMSLLNNDPSFLDALSSGTGDKARVVKRFVGIKDLIQNVLLQ